MTDVQREWDPQKTWIFAVGILAWKHEEVWAPFPDAVAGRLDEKLVEFFHSVGVPDDQIVYLQDTQATLDQIQNTLPEFLSHPGEDDLFILYFAGHGDWDSELGEHYFINYDANPDNRDNYWAISSIFDDIENHFNGSQVLFLADCCFSGGLIDELKQRETEIAYACVTSAYSHNLSTGQWTFTESLYQGLLGNPIVDLDEDGVITLYDFARHAELEMAFIEEQKSMFITINDFDQQMQLASVSDEFEPVEGKRVEVEYEGEWYKAKTLQRDNGQVLIQYMGDDGEPEWVEEDRIRPYDPDMFAIGDEVEVEYQEEWYSARVKKAWYGLHWVSYDDCSEEWEEWVGSDRIRPRP